MKFSIFNFMEVLGFAAPFGCGLLTGLKAGALGTFVGLGVGLAVGAGTFSGVIFAVKFCGKWALRRKAGAFQELVLGALLIGGFIAVFAMSFSSMYLTRAIARQFGD